MNGKGREGTGSEDAERTRWIVEKWVKGKGSVDINLVWVMMFTSPRIQTCDKQYVSGIREIYST